MPASSRLPVATLAAALLLLTACGGGQQDSEQSVSVDELTTSSAPALAGDWSFAVQERFLDVRSSAQWADIWSRRRSALDCSQPYNQEACTAQSPPQIDFERYRLVALLMGTIAYFEDPTPRKVAYSARSSLITLSYKCVIPFKTPFYSYTFGKFLLLPKSDASLVVVTSGA